jgi:hypothetical protein
VQALGVFDLRSTALPVRARIPSNVRTGGKCVKHCAPTKGYYKQDLIGENLGIHIFRKIAMMECKSRQVDFTTQAAASNFAVQITATGLVLSPQTWTSHN